MKNKKLILIPASAAERIYPLRPENRLLSAVGQFEPKRLKLLVSGAELLPHDAEH